MKQIFSITILVFAFCFAAFAQASECPKINISAPETVEADEDFRVSAGFENEKQPSTSQFNWTIVKGAEVYKISERKIIKIERTNWIKGGGTIILLAESLDKKCPDPAMQRVTVLPRVGDPVKLDEYGDLNWNDERARLENLVYQLKTSMDAALFMFISFDKKTSQAQRKNYLMKVLNELTVVRKLERSSITFLISESGSKRIYFQFVPKESSHIYYGCDDCLVIRAEDFEMLENLFRPNPINTKRKK